MTKLNRLEKFLRSGSGATPRQITGMFGLQNPHGAIHSLRSAGVCVYANPVTLTNGTKTTRYVIGAPTRDMIKLAHSAGLFA